MPHVPSYKRDRRSPYDSPAAAPADVLKGLPCTVVLFPCQWDGSAAEAGRFGERLERNAGKIGIYRVVPEARHDSDPALNPFYWSAKRAKYYRHVCEKLKAILTSPGETDLAINFKVLLLGIGDQG